ncbi:MAG: two-component system, NarL family, sensor kinase [Frankiaceae bacterium]|nr:two-component system, NarL family, sensor kinase [Frankiaceae bacterium]
MAGGRWAVTRPVLQFTLAGIIAVAIVGVATAVASRRVGQREATVDARTTTLVKAQTVIEPAVTNGLLTAAPTAVAKIDAVVRKSVLDRSLVRVKVWTRDGTIVYSDEPRLEGSHYTLGVDEIAALDHGVIEAEVSDLSKPENRFERGHGKLLEVYLPIRAPDGKRLLFEANYRYDAVSASGNRIWRSFAPVSIGALIALELVQIPLAWSLARRLRSRQQERERLLRQAIDASDAERRRIASDLHDGVVQDLAGVAYQLAGSARREGLPPLTTSLLEESAAHVQDSIKSLRSLLVDIYPAKLAEAGLPAALTDLIAGVANRGIATGCDVEGLHDDLPDAVAALLYRAAQEALRNVVAHAQASHVQLTVASTGDRVWLDVSDDGVGFTPALAHERAAEGHLGLRGLTDLVAGAGGRLDIDSEPGSGTRMHVEVPIP